MTDALQTLVSDCHLDRDLTIRYYARKVLRYIRCRFIAEKWTEFKNKPIHEQSYYQGLVNNFFVLILKIVRFMFKNVRFMFKNVRFMFKNPLFSNGRPSHVILPFKNRTIKVSCQSLVHIPKKRQGRKTEIR